MSATKRELLEERWKVLMLEPYRMKDEDAISGDNSKRFYRINETLEELAAMLVDEVMEHEVDAAGDHDVNRTGPAIGLLATTEWHLGRDQGAAHFVGRANRGSA